MFAVQTNDKTFVTDATEDILKRVYVEYVQRKVKEGMPLSKVVFTYREVKFISVKDLIRR